MSPALPPTAEAITEVTIPDELTDHLSSIYPFFIEIRESDQGFIPMLVVITDTGLRLPGVMPDVQSLEEELKFLTTCTSFLRTSRARQLLLINDAWAARYDKPLATSHVPPREHPGKYEVLILLWLTSDQAITVVRPYHMDQGKLRWDEKPTARAVRSEVLPTIQEALDASAP